MGDEWLREKVAILFEFCVKLGVSSTCLPYTHPAVFSGSQQGYDPLNKIGRTIGDGRATAAQAI